MRYIGECPSEGEAARITCYLVINAIDAVAEESDGVWQIWVRDEDKTAIARDEFESFKADPANARYATAVADAESRVQAEAARRLEAHRRSTQASEQKDPRRLRPRLGPAGPRPVYIITVIAVSLLATVLTGFGNTSGSNLASEAFDSLAFVGNDAFNADENPLASVQRGELWRLITPIFLHMDILHILVNCLMLYIMGRQIEWERGPYFLAFFILVVGLAANLGQAILPQLIGEYKQFGGLSGVVYGIFGYIWICSRTGQGRYFMPDFVVLVMLVMFSMSWMGELNITDQLEPKANWNHTFGLLAGIAWAMRGASSSANAVEQ
jgi:GlpG protein